MLLQKDVLRTRKGQAQGNSRAAAKFCMLLMSHGADAPLVLGQKQCKAYPSQTLLNMRSGEAHVDNVLHHGWVRLSCWPDDSGCSVEDCCCSGCPSGAVSQDVDDLPGDTKAALGKLVV